jgi:hypothetical protein
VLLLFTALSVRADVPLSLARYGVSAIGGAPVVASNGSDVLILWRSQEHIRALPPSVRHGGGLPIATPIADDANTYSHIKDLSIAWSGSRFALVYQRNGGAGVTMLDGDGNVVVAAHLISPDADVGTTPQITWDGRHFFVVYRSSRLPGICGQFLDGDGNKIGDPISIFTPTYPQYNISVRVASNGNGFMVVLTDAVVHAIAVDSNGKFIRQTTPDAAFGVDSAITTDGHDYLITWLAAGSHTIRAEIVASDATPRSAMQTVSSATPGTIPSLAWNGSSYVLATNESGEIHVRHVASDATPLGDDVLAAGGAADGVAPSIASAGGDDVVAFEQNAPDAVRAMSVHPGAVTPLAGLGDDAIASIGAADQDHVAAATNRFGTLVVWREVLASSMTHRFARIAAGNRWPDADGTVLRANPESQVAVATNGDIFLLAWIEQRGVRITRVDRNGSLIDGAPRTLLEPRPSAFLFLNSIAAVAVGNSFVVIYPDAGALAATRLDASDGHVVETRIIRPQIAFDSAIAPAARFNGETLLVAYVRNSPCFRDAIDGICTISQSAEAIALDASLQPKTQMPIMLGDSGVADRPSVEWNGTRFVVAYADFFDVRAFTLDANARLISNTSLVGMTANDFHRFRSAAVALDHNLFRIFATEEQVFAPDLRAVTEVSLDADVNRVTPPSRRNVVFDYDAPAASGSLVFYPARINEAPFFGAKRIQVIAPQQELVPPSNVQLDGSRVTWTYPDNTAGAFRIEVRLDNGAFREVAMTSGDARSAIIEVTPGATVRVRAWSIGGMSDYATASPR